MKLASNMTAKEFKEILEMYGDDYTIVIQSCGRTVLEDGQIYHNLDVENGIEVVDKEIRILI